VSLVTQRETEFECHCIAEPGLIVNLSVRGVASSSKGATRANSNNIEFLA